MRRLLLLALAIPLAAQNPNTAAFPSAAATDSTLFVATNAGSTTLNGSISNSVTSIVLTSGTNFVAPVIIAVDPGTASLEIMHCSSLSTNTLTCTRGQEGTSAASHSSGAIVQNIVTSWHHNQVAAEVKAIETQIPKLTGLLYGNNTSPNTAATGHAVAAVLTCATSSNSGTAETCSTSPSFTPAAGDCVVFQADIANTGAFTLNVNSLGVKSVKKNGTAALVANDILASPFQVILCYDGTNWEMQGQTGNASGGGASIFPQHVQSAVAARGTVTTFSLPFSGTSGNIEIVGIGWEGGANTASSLSDNRGTSYTKVVELTGNANENVAIYVGALGSSGTVTFTATFPSGAGFEGAFASEFLASTLTTTVDTSTSARNASITLTTTTAGDLLWMFSQGSGSSGVIQQPPTWSLIAQSSGSDSGNAATLVQNAAGFIAATPATNSNANWAYAAVALKHP